MTIQWNKLWTLWHVFLEQFFFWVFEASLAQSVSFRVSSRTPCVEPEETTTHFVHNQNQRVTHRWTSLATYQTLALGHTELWSFVERCWFWVAFELEIWVMVNENLNDNKAMWWVLDKENRGCERCSICNGDKFYEGLMMQKVGTVTRTCMAVYNHR